MPKVAEGNGQSTLDTGCSSSSSSYGSANQPHLVVKQQYFVGKAINLKPKP